MPLSPSFLIATAGALLGLKPTEAQRRTLARQFLRGTSHPSAARWDAAFVYHLGYWAHFDHRSGRSTWPLPATPACGDLAQFAEQRGALSDEPPQRGELYLLWSPSRQAFVRTGIVIGVAARETHASGAFQYECHTIEGNVTASGRLDGDRMGRASRFLSPSRGDRTIRWTDLEERDARTRRIKTAALREYEVARWRSAEPPRSNEPAAVETAR